MRRDGFGYRGGGTHFHLLSCVFLVFEQKKRRTV